MTPSDAVIAVESENTAQAAGCHAGEEVMRDAAAKAREQMRARSERKADGKRQAKAAPKKKACGKPKAKAAAKKEAEAQPKTRKLPGTTKSGKPRAGAVRVIRPADS